MGSVFLKRFSKITSKLIFPAVILIPFCLYLFLCQDFIVGRIAINIDTAAHYTVTKYYINNLLEGIIPLWEPFIHSGRPFLGMINCGMLNPLINTVLLGVIFGLNYYDAYILFILFYYFLGLMGFFVLSRIILRSSLYAFFAYTALMFSGMGIMVFNQIIVLLIFVTSVWFFVFLLRFLNGFQKRDFLGLVVAAILMEVSYYPFYLLTFLLVCILVCLVYYPDRVRLIGENTLRFFRRNKAIVSIALAGLIVSTMPLVLYKLHDQAGEIISPCRHIDCSTSNLDACLKGSAMNFEDVGYFGTLFDRVSLKAFFSGFDKFSYLRDGCFYVPLFCLIIILASSFTHIDRLRKAILWIWFVTFLISIGAATPVYGFLFKHVFYFQYFRNLFYFMAFLIPLMVLFSALQLKSMLSVAPTRKLLKLTSVVVLHFIFLMVVHRQGNALVTTYLIVIASFVFFMLYYFRNAPIRNLHIAVIFVLIILQPIQVFFSYAANAGSLGLNGPLFSAYVKPDVAFQRPVNSRDGHSVFRLRDYDFESDLKMSDSDGRLVIMPYSVSRWYFLMINKMSEESVLGYIRNKFYLYNNYEFYNMNDEAVWKNVEQGITDNMDVVYAFDGRTSEGSIKKNYQKGVIGKVQVIDETFDGFKITNFNVNEIKALYSLEMPKFLVYTDNFTSDWRAYIDGRETQVYRSNIAFKGVMLPAGKHILSIAYRPLGGTMIYWICAVVIFILMLLLCFVFLVRPGKVQENGDRDFSESDVSRFAGGYSLLYTAGIYYLIVLILYLGLLNPKLL
jgi:hypothetical protein